MNRGLSNLKRLFLKQTSTTKLKQFGREAASPWPPITHLMVPVHPSAISLAMEPSRKSIIVRVYMHKYSNWTYVYIYYILCVIHNYIWLWLYICKCITYMRMCLSTYVSSIIRSRWIHYAAYHFSAIHGSISIAVTSKKLQEHATFTVTTVWKWNFTKMIVLDFFSGCYQDVLNLLVFKSIISG